jgi:spermidine synthase
VMLAGIQMAMGLLALFTLFVYGSTFDWMGTVMNMFARTEQGYAGFNWASHAIASAVMLPATFCAGMTLPVITFAALRGGAGERAIGGVYAANTVGAILGVVLAVHVLMPLFNSKGVVIAGAALDFGLGLALLRGTGANSRFPRFAVASFIGSIAFLWAVLVADIDPLKIVSSVFRHGISRPTMRSSTCAMERPRPSACRARTRWSPWRQTARWMRASTWARARQPKTRKRSRCWRPYP